MFIWESASMEYAGQKSRPRQARTVEKCDVHRPINARSAEICLAHMVARPYSRILRQKSGVEWLMKLRLKLAFESVLLAGVVALAQVGPVYAAHARRMHPRTAPPPAVPLSSIYAFGNRPAPFALDARAAELMALHSGVVLYAYNQHEKMQPASLAKLMTFYIVLKALKQGRITPETEVPISEKAWRLSLNSSVSRMFLQVGQKVDVNDLLYGLMVSSGNDAAVALSEYLAGSTDAFAQEMNKEAAQLGLTETHFINPDGLPEPGEYTTAADMVKLGRAVLETFPDATKYTETKEFTFDKISQRNFNTLLFYDSRVNGLKTGHVEEAGYHLVASSHSDDLDLVSAVLGTPSSEKRRTETEKLIDWAFRTFVTVSPNWHKVVPATVRVYQGDLEDVPIAPQGGNSYFTVEQGQQGRVKLVANMSAKPLVAPLPKGAQVGELTVMIDGKPQSSIPIVTEKPVERGGYIHNLVDALRMRI
jgi:D-alanyl-D-alanine carboxypeptidase (penicillin-binding protein 5/6)